jgi:hypothetical protein
MKETEGGVITLDPHCLPTVVLELRRRGYRRPGSVPPLDGCAGASPKGAADEGGRRGHHRPGSALPPDGCVGASPKGAPDEGG